MTDFARRAVRSVVIAATAALMLPGSAGAQMQSSTYKFLKAVRDADGTEVTNMLNTPGSTVIDSRDATNGQTALHIVTARRDLSWISFLLSKGAKPQIKDRQGDTPLMIAAQLGFSEGAALLASRGRVDEPNNQGETPLIRAVQLRDIRMVRLLLDAGANPDRRDTLAGLSARDYAKRDARSTAVLKAIEDGAKKPKPSTMGPN